jgi:hypothetical protein
MITFFLFLVSTAYGLSIYISDAGSTIQISDTKMVVEYEYEFPVYAREEYDITWETINKINYIRFYYNGNFMDAYANYMENHINHGLKRYLVLSGSNFLIFYNEQNKVEYKIDSTRTGTDELSCDIKASSELRENKILYSADNLLKMNSLIPWVEGSNGNGVGEKINIEIKSDWRSSNIIYQIWISNGFIDYNRPYLYEYNNRIKKIRIRNLENPNQWKDFEFRDISNIQEVDLRFLSTWKIEIEILEVYQGTKHNDTCINFIIPAMFMKI